MRPNTLVSYRKIFILILILVLPALACNPLSGAKEDVEENASVLVEGIVDAVGEQIAEDQSNSSESSDEQAETGQTGDSTPADPAEESSGPGDSQEEIAGALKSSLAVDSMRIDITSEESNTGVITTLSMAFVRPDRYEMISDDVHIIVIEGTSYIGSSSSDWSVAQVDMTSTVEETLQAFVSSEAIDERLEESSDDWSSVKSLGTEMINGVETRGYEYEDRISDEFYSLIRMWIGEDDGLLYRQEIESSIGGIENHTLMEFEYGDDVSIEPPV